MKAAILLAVLLAACGQQTSSPSNEVATAAPAAKPAAPTAKAFVYDEKNELWEYHFAWSAEAAAVPQLVSRLKVEMQKTVSELKGAVDRGKAASKENGFPFNPYSMSIDYKTAGQSDRLLSLSVEAGSYTGGAHGNAGVSALLWDRAAARQIQFAELFAARPNMDRLLTQRWCDALNKEREKKRGEPVGGGGMFDECPKLDEIAIIPSDKDGNRRFETLAMVASPYVAGPWAEGSYEIELEMTPELLAALKGAYRDSFEVQTQ